MRECARIREKDGKEKVESLHTPFLSLFSEAKFFAYTITAEGGEELQGVGEQVRDCLEKLDIFKTLNQIRYT